ncbi:hypothetical protein Leryth_027630, partial [Lithospermum erythrorhizon]
ALDKKIPCVPTFLVGFNLCYIFIELSRLDCLQCFLGH